MKAIRFCILISFLSVLFSCAEQVDFSNPKSVIEYYYSLKSNGELELEYELLADTCREIATLQDYLNAYSDLDSLLKEYDYFTQNIDQLPIDPKNPKYRHFEIQYASIRKNDMDTTMQHRYQSVFNEKGQWKVIWTKNISDAAIKLRRSQKYSDAIEASREVLKYDPLNGIAYGDIGICQLRQGYYQDALTNAQKAVELNPKNWANYNLLASIYSNQDNDELAVETFKKAIDMTNSDAQKVNLLSNLSNSYLSLYKYDEAKQTLNHALKIDSNHTHAWWRKGIVFSREYMSDSAITCLQKAVDLKPMSDFLQRKLYYDLALLKRKKCGWTHIDNKEYCEEVLNEAKTYILKALDLDYDNQQYKWLLDDINNTMENFE